MWDTSGAGYCSKFSTTNTSSPVFRPFAQFFEVALGTGGVVCEQASPGDLQSCLLFNGRVKPPTSPQSSLFAFEPNAYKDPRNFTTTSKGPVLGVPVEFSLLFSADGSAPATGSYLAQICAALDPATGKVATTYNRQGGFLALEGFWTRLNTTVAASAVDVTGSGGSGSAFGAYAAFSRVYFAYAVTTRFLLSLYRLAPLAHKLGTASVALALFETTQQWAANTAGAWAGVSTLYSASQFLPGLASSSLFTDARPLVGVLNSDGYIPVTLTVPSLLLGWSPAALLLAAFPFTPSTFSTVLEFDPGTAFAQVLGGVVLPTDGATASGTSNPFIVAGAASVEYFSIDYSLAKSQGTVVPVSSASGTAAPPTSSTSSAVVAGKLSFKVLAASGSMTLLFYLYYIHSHGTSAFSGADAAALVADGEPAVLPVPAALDWSVACGLVASKQCTGTGYTGAGSSAVNALFLNMQSTVCKCIFPTNASNALSTQATLDPSSMCFNSNCRSTGQTTVDRASLIAGALAGTDCTGTIAGSDDPASTAAASSAATATLAVPAATSSATSMCSSLCPTYLDVMANSVVDTTSVDVVALRDDCGVDLTTAAPAPLAVWPAAVAFCALLVACVPVFFAASLLASAAFADRSGHKSSGSNKNSSPSIPAAGSTLVPLRPAFYGVAIAAFVLCCAAAAYAWVDLKGTATCAGGALVLTNGYSLPASTCMSNGVVGTVAALAGITVPAFPLPPSFCPGPASYCQCNYNPAHGATISSTSSAGACGCSSAACCSSNGLRTSETNAAAPFTGRGLQMYLRDLRFDPLMLAVCGAAALCIVPACTSALWLGTRSFVGKPAVAAALVLVLLGFCAVPMAVQALDKRRYRRYDVAVGPCAQLTEYPSVVARTDTPGITYSVQMPAGASVPTYTLDSDSISATSADATASVPLNLAYSTALGFSFSAAPGTTTTYVNDANSSIVFAGVPASSTTAALPPLYSVFRSADDYNLAFSVCGISAAGATTCAT